MKMYINGIEILCDKDITITEQILSTSSVILNNVFPKEWDNDKDYVSRFYFPEDYGKFTMYDDENNLIFAGVVKNTGNINLNPRYPHYTSLQILDYKTFLSEGETLDFVISGKTILEAINMVIDEIKDYGFELGEVEILNEDDVIGAYNTQNQTAYDVFQYLSEISQSKWFTRVKDENKVLIDFYDPTLMEEGTELEYTKEFFEENKILDISYKYSTNDYRNKQVMLSNEIFSNINQLDSFYTSGYDTQFMLTQNVGKIISIRQDNVSKTFASQEEKKIGIEADFYYSIGTNVLESELLLTTGTRLEILYTPLVKGRQVIYNTSEVNRIANNTNRKGVIARYESRNDVLSSEELQAVGESYLRYKGTSEITLTVKTQNSELWNIGQIIEWNDAPLDELNKTYMVKTKKIQRIYAKDLITMFYTYELTSSFNSENAINYFDNQRRKAVGNITEGQYIDRNYDIENSVNIIFDNFEVVSEEENTNVLDCVLDAPFSN